MSLRDRLTEDLKLAMKARDQLRMDVIRMIKAAVLNKEVEMKKDLDDAEMSRIMTTMIKQRKESVEQFEKGQRAELAAKERQEISIIEAYLPKAISPDELDRTVDAVIRNFEIIGEAANRLPEEFKDRFPEIDWHRIRGFRNRIVHDYFGIDYSIVWTIKETFLPLMIAQLKPISET